jgi:hypothetical protein
MSLLVGPTVISCVPYLDNKREGMAKYNNFMICVFKVNKPASNLSMKNIGLVCIFRCVNFILQAYLLL